MSRTKKIILIVVGVIVLLVGAATVYLLKVNSDVDQAISKMTKKVNYKNTRSDTVDLKSGEPFSILLMGTDTGDKGRTYQGRSDSMMLVTINCSLMIAKLIRSVQAPIMIILGMARSFIPSTRIIIKKSK